MFKGCAAAPAGDLASAAWLAADGAWCGCFIRGSL